MWCGDSRAIVCSEEGKVLSSTRDHTPSNEEEVERLKKDGRFTFASVRFLRACAFSKLALPPSMPMLMSMLMSMPMPTQRDYTQPQHTTQHKAFHPPFAPKAVV